MRCSQLLVSGTPSRFCQKCKRFHPLAEFDGEKRSCRVCLQRHNAKQKLLRAIKHNKDPSFNSQPLSPPVISEVPSMTDVGGEPSSVTDGMNAVTTCKNEINPDMIAFYLSAQQQQQLQQQQQAQQQAAQQKQRLWFAEAQCQHQAPFPSFFRGKTPNPLSISTAPSFTAPMPQLSENDVQQFLSNLEGTFPSLTNPSASAFAPVAQQGSFDVPTEDSDEKTLKTKPSIQLSLSASIMARLMSDPLDSVLDQALLEYCMNQWGSSEQKTAASSLPPVLQLPPTSIR